ncbi:hypothetical protein AURDEDRAFT_120956 [Auricularia subglabra TFB-10046 SS5]|nr:hypothetical protein AURDEDRAFT_120956 [Auricularia subglabra TFB-10046 SS5]
MSKPEQEFEVLVDAENHGAEASIGVGEGAEPAGVTAPDEKAPTTAGGEGAATKNAFWRGIAAGFVLGVLVLSLLRPSTRVDTPWAQTALFHEYFKLRYDLKESAYTTVSTCRVELLEKPGRNVAASTKWLKAVVKTDP